MRRQTITVNHFAAEEIYTRLLRQLDESRFPYNQPEAQVPQDPRNLPKNLVLGGREHALYLFHACYNMSGIESDVAFRLLGQMYVEHPDFFRPEYIVEHGIDADTIASTLSRFRLNYKAYVNGQFWVKNAHTLYRHWGSDPRNLFIGTSSYEDLLDRIRNKGKKSLEGTEFGGMFGFQHKMVSMLAYFISDGNLVSIPYLFPFPVDIHHLRVHLIQKIVVVKGGPRVWYTGKLLETIRDLSVWYCRLHGFSTTNKLADAIWLLSKHLCSQHPGNASSIKRWPRKEGEPRYMGRKRKVKNKKTEWTKAQINSYNRACGNCPIEGTCELLIPSAHYYVQGSLKKAGIRTKPPQSLLFSIHPERIRPQAKRSQKLEDRQPSQNSDRIFQLQFFKRKTRAV